MLSYALMDVDELVFSIGKKITICQEITLKVILILVQLKYHIDLRQVDLD
jgi:hypothetical protein